MLHSVMLVVVAAAAAVVVVVAAAAAVVVVVVADDAGLDSSDPHVVCAGVFSSPMALSTF